MSVLGSFPEGESNPICLSASYGQVKKCRTKCRTAPGIIILNKSVSWVVLLPGVQPPLIINAL